MNDTINNTVQTQYTNCVSSLTPRPIIQGPWPVRYISMTDRYVGRYTQTGIDTYLPPLCMQPEGVITFLLY